MEKDGEERTLLGARCLLVLQRHPADTGYRAGLRLRLRLHLWRIIWLAIPEVTGAMSGFMRFEIAPRTGALPVAAAD